MLEKNNLCLKERKNAFKSDYQWIVPFIQCSEWVTLLGVKKILVRSDVNLLMWGVVQLFECLNAATITPDESSPKPEAIYCEIPHNPALQDSFDGMQTSTIMTVENISF